MADSRWASHLVASVGRSSLLSGIIRRSSCSEVGRGHWLGSLAGGATDCSPQLVRATGCAPWPGSPIGWTAPRLFFRLGHTIGGDLKFHGWMMPQSGFHDWVLP